MTKFRSMPTLLRFVVWLFLALLLTFGVGGTGYFLAASALKPYLISALQDACNLLLAWIFGLIGFRTRLEIATSIMVIIFSLSMRIIVIVFAIIITTLFCGIDACVR